MCVQWRPRPGPGPERHQPLDQQVVELLVVVQPLAEVGQGEAEAPRAVQPSGPPRVLHHKFSFYNCPAGRTTVAVVASPAGIGHRLSDFFAVMGYAVEHVLSSARYSTTRYSWCDKTKPSPCRPSTVTGPG